MKKAICHYYSKPLEEVFDAYKRAVKDVLDADAKKMSDGALAFGLRYSLKYNMNGGGCSVRFLQYKGGTLVEAEYILAQAAGARCSALDGDIAEGVENILRVESRVVYEDFDELVRRQNEPTPIPRQGYAPNGMQNNNCRANFCMRCGKPFGHNDNFCTNCGAKRQ